MLSQMVVLSAWQQVENGNFVRKMPCGVPAAEIDLLDGSQVGGDNEEEEEKGEAVYVPSWCVRVWNAHDSFDDNNDRYVNWPDEYQTASQAMSEVDAKLREMGFVLL